MIISSRYSRRTGIRNLCLEKGPLFRSHFLHFVGRAPSVPHSFLSVFLHPSMCFLLYCRKSRLCFLRQKSKKNLGIPSERSSLPFAILAMKPCIAPRGPDGPLVPLRGPQALTLEVPRESRGPYGLGDPKDNPELGDPMGPPSGTPGCSEGLSEHDLRT